MSLYNRSFLARPDPSFVNLFRMLDDFASITEGNSDATGAGAHRSFTPRFDVRETETAYEFHGELPGIARENLTIEFPEPQTLSIRGRVEREYTSGTPPAAAIEDTQMSGALAADSEASHRASVSDEETEAAKEKGVTTTTPARDTQAKPSARKERYWHRERSIGEFHRTFNFPTRVDENAVSASLNRGVLHLTVPKATKREPRHITIN